MLWRSELKSIDSVMLTSSIRHDGGVLMQLKVDWRSSSASHGGDGAQVLRFSPCLVAEGCRGSRAASAALFGSIPSKVSSSASCSLAVESAGRAAATPTLLGACCVLGGMILPPGLDAMVEAFCFVRYAPATVPQVVPSPAVLWSTVLRSMFRSVEMELDKDLDLIAFPYFVLGSWM